MRNLSIVLYFVKICLVCWICGDFIWLFLLFFCCYEAFHGCFDCDYTESVDCFREYGHCNLFNLLNMGFFCMIEYLMIFSFSLFLLWMLHFLTSFVGTLLKNNLRWNCLHDFFLIDNVVLSEKLHIFTDWYFLLFF